MYSPGGGVLGLFGGTFDPLHVGHLRLALEARESLGLDEVCFIPAGNPPLRSAPNCSPEHRLAMAKAALAKEPGCSIDDSEVLNLARTPEPSYTVMTLERHRRQHGPSRPMVLLLGADAFARLETWYRWRDLFDLAHIAVATRPGHNLTVVRNGAPAGPPTKSTGSPHVSGIPPSEQVATLDQEFDARRGEAADLANAPAGRIVSFSISALEISATAVRRRLESGLSVRYLVPDAVLDYIDSNQLYRTPHGH